MPDHAPDGGGPPPFSLPDDADLLSAVGSESLVLQNKRNALATEATNRSNLQIAIVSSALVAAGFVVRTPSATSFLLIVPPILLVLGGVTFARLVTIARDDRRYDLQLEWIRAGFAQLSPRGPAYFRPQSTNIRSVDTRLLPLTSASGFVGLINAAIAGTYLSLVFATLTGDLGVWQALGGLAVSVLSAVLQLLWAQRATSIHYTGPAGTPAAPGAVGDPGADSP